MVFIPSDPVSFERCGYREIFQPGGLRISIEDGPLNRTYLRRRPLYHDDPNNVGIFHDLSTTEINYPPAALIAASKVRLIGFRTYIKENGVFFNDEWAIKSESRKNWLERLSSTDTFFNEKTGLTRVDESTFNYDARNRAVIELDEPVIVISSDEPENYGSFLFRVLAKMTPSLRRLKLRVLAPAPYPSMVRALHLAGIGPERLIIHNPACEYRIAHAIIPTLRNPHAFLDESSLGLFTEIRNLIRFASNSRRILISRKNLSSTPSGYRQIKNADEMNSSLCDLGFEIFEPQNATFDEQIEAFASALIVVGQSGAGLFNSVFCLPGTHLIDIESEPHWIHAHMCLFSSLNLRYSVFEGVPDYSEHKIHVPLTVNVCGLTRRIRHILETF